ncbi:N-acetyltransferase GCN5 [Xylariales sp. PMI_506]|nr:N-acetyltransferase GCN5 [Xylariales sp. PMI_506]
MNGHDTADCQVSLGTARLILLPLSTAHLELLVALNSDTRVMKYVESGKPLNREESEQDFRDRMATSQRIPGLGHWAGFKDGAFVGWWALSPVRNEQSDIVKKEAELGYRLASRFWKRGLAKEGAIALVQHGFQDLGLSRISAQTMAVNAASRATMEASGLRYVRTFHIEFDGPIPGTEEGEVEYAVTREQWLERNSIPTAIAIPVV